jgi:3-methyladenine DNA glycosylase Tag
MASNNTNSIVDFSAILNASVENQVKIQTAVTNAKKALELGNQHNAARKAAASELVSKIQSDLNKQLVDTQKAQKEAYEQSLCAVGLSAQVYPMQTAMKAADDKILTPALASVGTVAGHVTNASVGLWNRVTKGFKAATK